MEFNGLLQLAVSKIRPETVIRIAKEARPSSDYFFNTILPERTTLAREVSSHTMRIRSVMAGLVAMDAPFPEGAYVELSDFSERLVKIAHQGHFNEGNMVALQDIIRQILLTKGQGADGALKVLIKNFLNFADKILVQPHMDTAEWLRATALRTGRLDWQFGTQKLEVDYGMKEGAYAINRTGNDAYNGSASKFWQDVRSARTFLNNDIQVFVAHGQTIDAILTNPANNLELVGDLGNTIELQRIIERNGKNEVSKDTRDRIKLVSYNLEAEVVDTTTPGKTKIVQFLPPGEILAIGNGTNRGFFLTDNVGDGSTSDPNDNVSLGYTAIGPVTENDGKAGRWARIYTPEAKPASLVGQSVSTILPVIEGIDKVFRLKTSLT